jgi:hypothetical protein
MIRTVCGGLLERLTRAGDAKLATSSANVTFRAAALIFGRNFDGDIARANFKRVIADHRATHKEPWEPKNHSPSPSCRRRAYRHCVRKTLFSWPYPAVAHLAFL